MQRANVSGGLELSCSQSSLDALVGEADSLIILHRPLQPNRFAKPLGKNCKDTCSLERTSARANSHAIAGIVSQLDSSLPLLWGCPPVGESERVICLVPTSENAYMKLT